jgi:Flp pilus assembly pilin Flp
MVALAGRLAALRRWTGPAEGQGLVEYGLILTLIAIVAIASLAAAGNTLATMLQNVGTSV